MTERQRIEILKQHVIQNCQFIKAVRKNRIIFTNHFYATEGYRFIFHNLFPLCGGMYMNGGGNTLYFK